MFAPLLLLCLHALAAGPAARSPVAPPATPVNPAATTEASPETSPQATSVISASLVLKVAIREPAADALVAQARSLGGWFSERSETSVVLRVPSAAIDSLVAHAVTLGVVADRSWSRTDHGAELSELRARLGAREVMLGRYQALLGQADAQAVLTVEREVLRLVTTIEELRGRIRFLENQVAFARLDVSFQFQDRTAPITDGSSSFAWINTVNLTDLLNDLRWGVRRGAGPSGVLPAGFAPYRSKHAWRAASPDGVVYRERSERHKPKADLTFWREALKNRMLSAGYQLVDEGELTRGATPGAWIELTAPVGPVDYRYIVAIFPEGRRLRIIEAAGDTVPYTARREALLAAIRGD